MEAKLPLSFKFFDGYAQAIEALDELTETLGLTHDEIYEAKKDFTYDIVMYGCYLIEPDFSRYDIAIRTAVRMAFGVMRPSIDKSHRSAAAGRTGGKKGGRGNKKGVRRKKPDVACDDAAKTCDEIPDDNNDYKVADLPVDLAGLGIPWPSAEEVLGDDY